MSAESYQYSKSDFGALMTWEQYGTLLEKLYREVSQYLDVNNIHPDVVVPIFRAAGIPGQYLAYKLKLLKILSVQYKYLKHGDKIELVQLQGFRKELLQKESPILLLLKNPPCLAATQKAAVDDLKKIYPTGKILYAAVCADYTHKELKGVEKTFYAAFTNSTRGLSEAEATKLNVPHKIALFPWENFEEELAAVTGQKFDYK